MLSTMQDFPLTIGMIFRHGRAVYGDSEVVTFEGDSSRRASFAQVADRVDQLSAALRRLGVESGDRVAHLRVEHPGASRGVLRDSLHGRRAPHAQHPPVPRAAHLHREPRGRQDRHRRRHAGAGAGQARAGAADAWSTTSSWATPTPPRSRATAREVLRYDELLAAEQPGIAYPEIDERAAAAMCYTSGTTGNPKGVVYSHRSTFLHSIGVLQSTAVCFTDRDRVLPIVPMFHANAWGMPYAAWMAGADLIMPNRFLQAEPLARLIGEEKPTCAGAVPTIWTDLLHYAEQNPRRPLVDGARAVRRLGGAAVAHRALRGQLRRAHRAGLGHDRDEPARGDVVAAEGRRARDDRGDRLAGASPGASSPGVELRIVDDDGVVQPWDGEAVGEVQVRGPWITGSYYRDPGSAEVRRRLAPHRRHRERHQQRVHPDHRPRQGRHQVGRRVDLVGRARSAADGASRRGRGGRDRGARPEVGGAAARVRGVQGRHRA